MLGKLFRRWFRRPGPPRFDAVFEGPDDDLVMDLVGRIQGPDWESEHVLKLSAPEAHVVRLCRFSGVFGNGGLQYWFECDADADGKHTVEAFRAVGLDGAAAALDAAYEVFPTQKHYDDFEMRMAALRDLSEHFAPLEDQLWKAFDKIDARTAGYIRSHKDAFEHLRHVRPWCSLMEEFEDA